MKTFYAKNEDGDLISARDASKALRHFCPRCSERVRPIQGKKRLHHFRHSADSDCKGMGPRHALAQKIIAEGKILPDLFKVGKRLELDRVFVEQNEAGGAFRIDLLCEYDEGIHEGLGQGRLWVEVKDSSGCSANKVQEAEKRRMPLFEVDVSCLDYLDLKAFKAGLFDDQNWKRLKPEIPQDSLALVGGMNGVRGNGIRLERISFGSCRDKFETRHCQFGLPFHEQPARKVSILSGWILRFRYGWVGRRLSAAYSLCLQRLKSIRSLA